MEPVRLCCALTLTLIFGGCVPKPKPAPPPVQVRPAPTPAPAPSPPIVTSWMDAPATPGDWSYSEGVARFGEAASEPRFTMRCDPASRTIVLTRVGSAGRMVIRSETQTRAFTTPEPRLQANDRLLDAIALSKGRFAVEVAGQPTLYLPSWAEVTRVIEDCR